MIPTAIGLPEKLKARVDRPVAASGGTAQAFMVDAIAENTALKEQHQDFEAEAEAGLHAEHVSAVPVLRYAS